jgi:quercetin dioxygenase-like cupin family protein
MTTIERPRALHRSLLLAAGVLAVVGALSLTSTGDAQAEDPPQIGVQALSTPGQHNEFTDDVALQVRDKPVGRSTEVVNLRDASNMAVFEFTIQPGAMFPWHTHPGPVFAAVTQGDLVFIYGDDCTERQYNQGEAFVDPGLAHTAYNPGEEPTVVVAAVFGVASGAPPSTSVDPAQAAALNEACGTEAPVPQDHGH